MCCFEDLPNNDPAIVSATPTTPMPATTLLPWLVLNKTLFYSLVACMAYAAWWTSLQVGDTSFVITTDSITSFPSAGWTMSPKLNC